jgi:hypothetical protein
MSYFSCFKNSPQARPLIMAIRPMQQGSELPNYNEIYARALASALGNKTTTHVSLHQILCTKNWIGNCKSQLGR